jgi:O-antigen/teichoic acid export membrane protein
MTSPGAIVRLGRLRSLFSGHALGAVDQSIVSGVSFLCLIALAHWTNPQEFGAYVLANSLLGVLANLQHALIATPYSIQRHRTSASASELAFAGLAQCGLLAAASLVVLAALGGALRYFGSVPVSDILFALAIAVPFVLMRELVREFSFAHLRMTRALALDIAAASIQLGALCFLTFTGRLSAVTAVLTLGLVSGIPAMVSLYLHRADFSWRTSNLRGLMINSLRLGRWLLLSRSASLLQGYAGVWVSGLIAGVTTTAIYSACMSVVAFANPVLFGLYNVLTPRAAMALKEQGHSGMWRAAVHDAILLGAIMSVFVVIVGLAGEHLMALLYPRDYAGYAALTMLLAVAALITAIGIPASNGMASLERGRQIASVSIASSMFNLALVAVLLAQYDLLGAGVAAVIGSLVTAFARWMTFRRCLAGPQISLPVGIVRS